MNQEIIGKNIKQKREDAGLTQADFAERSDVSVVHISHIENGKAKMSQDLMLTMCHVLKCTPNDIFEGAYTWLAADNDSQVEASLNSDDQLLLQHIRAFLSKRHGE
ncbi:MAG: helix-turn-helix domain-containing protein [Clostridiaceae bacterium]|nr:helix-turn-helix domain-containing protein [Clostridiaceae bacterium]